MVLNDKVITPDFKGRPSRKSLDGIINLFETGCVENSQLALYEIMDCGLDPKSFSESIKKEYSDVKILNFYYDLLICAGNLCEIANQIGIMLGFE